MIFQRLPSELMDVHSIIMDQFQNSDPVNMHENPMPKTLQWCINFLDNSLMLLEQSTQRDILPDFKITQPKISFKNASDRMFHLLWLQGLHWLCLAQERLSLPPPHNTHTQKASNPLGL